MKADLKTVKLFPNVNMSDVMRRFRASPETKIMKAYAPKLPKFRDQYWKIQFMGPVPNLVGLADESVS